MPVEIKPGYFMSDIRFPRTILSWKLEHDPGTATGELIDHFMALPEPDWHETLHRLGYDANEVIWVDPDTWRFYYVDEAFRRMNLDQREVVLANWWHVLMMYHCQIADKAAAYSMMAEFKKRYAALISMESAPGDFGQE